MRTDIWAFGVVLYEMLTGRRMFAGETVPDTLAAVLNKEPDWSALPAGTPPAVRRLLARCLERDRKKRLSEIGGCLRGRTTRRRCQARCSPVGACSGGTLGRGRRLAHAHAVQTNRAPAPRLLLHP